MKIQFDKGYYLKVYNNSNQELKYDNLVGTDYKIKLYNQSTGAFISQYTVLIYGDVDGDCNITSTDATMVMNHSAGNNILTGSFLKAADVSKNGIVDSLDALLIQRHLVKISYIVQ